MSPVNSPRIPSGRLRFIFICAATRLINMFRLAGSRRALCAGVFRPSVLRDGLFRGVYATAPHKYLNFVVVRVMVCVVSHFVDRSCTFNSKANSNKNVRHALHRQSWHNGFADCLIFFLLLWSRRDVPDVYLYLSLSAGNVLGLKGFSNNR